MKRVCESVVWKRFTNIAGGSLNLNQLKCKKFKLKSNIESIKVRRYTDNKPNFLLSTTYRVDLRRLWKYWEKVRLEMQIRKLVNN